MALPLKELRKITVDGVEYYWKISGQDYGVDLFVCDLTRRGQLLTVTFDYEHVFTGIAQPATPQPAKQVMITPVIVKRVIELGLESGWTPHQQGKIFKLNLARL